jgi:hypothetical protein
MEYHIRRFPLKNKKRRIVLGVGECFWVNHEPSSESDLWSTTCGNDFIINEGTPHENHMKFCCYCGGRLRMGK